MSRWTKRKLHISSGLIKIDQKSIAEVDSKIFSPCNRSFSRDRYRTRGNYNYRNNRLNFRDRFRHSYRCDNRRNNYQSNERHAITTDRTIGGQITIDKTIEIGKIIEEMTLDIRDRSESRDTLQEIIVMTVPEVEKEVETEMDRCNLDPELCQMTEDQGLDLILE